MLVSFAAFGLSVDFSAPVAAQEQPMRDLERLKTLPLIQVIRSSTAKYTATLTYGPNEPHHRLEGMTPLAAVEKLDPELRCLVWLMFFAHGWIFPDKRDWLHTFFFMQFGDFAPQVRDAFEQAGLSTQHQLFSEAMASFGPSYPLAYDRRHTYFAWATDADKPLTAIDRKLLTLSKRLGLRAGYDAAVEAYVRGHPKLTQWAQDMRPRVEDRDRLMWLTLRLHELVGSDDSSKQKLARLPKPHHQLVHLSIFEMEVSNGGIEQFFLNFSGDWAAEVAQTLNEVGLKKEAETVAQGIALFPAPYPVDRMRRVDLMTGRKGRALDKKLQEMSNRVEVRDTRRAMIELAKREGILPQ